ncbi:hypothetical protein [Streptomyces sp. UNOC14_S4]|uniref:hypothetical protein n=1 Tax=Streptomyces sp. UNOC14_S4 TaxID=2872340 RepID=UPI001E4F778B|nr:hypothetical protein [Streptomyces sp. UNOC14_S4]MCC3767911.1 hypothetical protein [Streptomyces sp. UNOC14_S4]
MRPQGPTAETARPPQARITIPGDDRDCPRLCSAVRPKRRVTFARRDERAAWLIHNDIDEDETGLTLTFSSTTDLGESEEDNRKAELMREGYLAALRSTMARMRETIATEGAASGAEGGMESGTESGTDDAAVPVP